MFFFLPKSKGTYVTLNDLHFSKIQKTPKKSLFLSFFFQKTFVYRTHKKKAKKKKCFLEGNNKVLITNEPLSSRCCSPF